MKKNIAVIFGGCSPEYRVSLESAYAVIVNLDSTRYHPVMTGISESGSWYLYSGAPEKLLNNTWCNEADCIPAVLSPNRHSHELLVLAPEGIRRICLDVVFPVLHGKNGEDGTVQGAVSLAGIPLAGCGILASALCMDKERAHQMVALSGIRVPKGLVLRCMQDMDVAEDFARKTGFPLFIKPVKAGSSYGITKVWEKEKLKEAVCHAFRYDDEVIVEESIEGFEVGCAVLGTDKLIMGEIDEIELSQGFFDFTEKYTLKTSAIHVPARISREKSEELKKTARRIYRTLGCSGFARVDMFLTPSGEIVFNEVNTIPGFTEHSRYPGMMKAAGIKFKEVLDLILEQAVAQ